MPAASGPSVAIIGLGSRGLSVLERIVTLARLAGPSGGSLRVEVIDPDCTGSGVHQRGQPDYLLLNTTCSQASMFPDSRTVGPEAELTGPSLYDWVSERGLRLAPDGYTVGATGRPIRPTDFLPRRLLGDYLGWFLTQVQASTPDHVQVTLHRATALDMSSQPGAGITITLSDDSRLQVGHVFLTTGYTANNSALSTAGRMGVIPDPYPLPDRLAAVEPAQTVAIGGFGLSAMDVMSALTVGRGGRFSWRDGQLRYEPSGREPKLALYSRSGVPCRARPRVVEFGPKYQPFIFTRARIDAIRKARGGLLDFDADLLPLVLAEMRIAYRRCEARCTGDDAEEALSRLLPPDAGLAEVSLGEVTAVLDDLDTQLGRFDPAATLDGSTGMVRTTAAAYQDWLARYLAEDLAEGTLGFIGSPVKASLDILRELRDTVRYAVDFGGLTATSLDDFTRRTIPMMNRAVVGPQYERHIELLALMKARIARVPFGPAPVVRWNDAAGRWTISSTLLGTPHAMEVDWIVAAHVPLPAVASSASPLITALYRKGWIRPHRPDSVLVRGIDVDRDQHPLDAGGQPDSRVWVLGPLCEGATFYNNLVPSPNTYSRPVFDAHRCVAAMFAAAGQPVRRDSWHPSSSEVPSCPASGRASEQAARQPIG